MSPLLTACPTCKRSVAWNADFPWRPFCSERCKLVDLGAWLSEQRKIAGEELPQEDAPGAGSRQETGREAQ